MNNDFPTPQEDLKRLADEISALRRVISEAGASIARIEKRVKSAYPNYPQSKVSTASPQVDSTPTKSREELMAIYESLLISIKERGEQGYEEKIATLSEADVVALAAELGLGNAKKMSLKKAYDGIRRRLQESAQLAYRPRERPSIEGDQTA